MRILRSEEWFPASLEDAATGDWRATVAYEGAATAFVDGSLDPLREFAAPLGVITLARYVAVQRDRPNRGSTRALAPPRALRPDKDASASSPS